MKKIVAFVLSAVMAAACAGCGSVNGESSKTQSGSTAATGDIVFGIRCRKCFTVKEFKLLSVDKSCAALITEKIYKHFILAYILCP